MEILKKNSETLKNKYFYKWIWNAFNKDRYFLYKDNKDFLLKFNLIKNNKYVRIKCLETKIIFETFCFRNHINYKMLILSV